MSPAAEQSRQALRDAYVDLLLLASRLMASPQRPEQARGLREAARRSLERHRAQLFAAGIPESLVNEAQVPVVCLLDEAAKRHRSFGEGWEDLQMLERGRLTGGEEFFKHLDQHRADRRAPIELFELYIRCLTLGFQGMYAPDRLKDLQIYKESLRNELRDRTGPLPPLCADLEAPQAARHQRPLLQWTWVPLMGMVLLCVTVLGLYLQVASASREATSKIDALAPRAAPPPPRAPEGRP